MVDFFAVFIATVITIPILVILLVYWITYALTKSKKRAFHLSLDYSTLIFILAVHYLLLIILERSFLWVIFLVLITIGMLFVFLQWKFNDEIVFKKVWKGFWRLNFLLFSLSYVCLVILGLIIRLNEVL
ncbi:DUF3397 domain-containing protein [Bacillus sp. Marseille-P3661]|uniref:DUF3397 domain-containing protein n=1 Tax=Bacillus sp. Marseille-P3661 TaxID=1936234 RepID=UPI000C823CFD|nr:DUF3397 domain-containing protein [Bacillus sp. Marseille-P3661]